MSDETKRLSATLDYAEERYRRSESNEELLKSQIAELGRQLTEAKKVMRDVCKKTVEVEYIESGAFQGGEEEAFASGIDYREDCIVVIKVKFEKLIRFLKSHP